MEYKNLFSPIKIGNIEIKNRTAMMAMGVFSQRLMNNDGSYTKDGADYYIERAKGGTGLIVTGLVPVIPTSPLIPCIMNNPETYVKNQKYLTEGIHSYGSKVFIQMSALSGRSSINPDDPAPSEMTNVWDPSKKNHEMTKAEIKIYISNFAEGAYLAKQAGADGVEIHAVHEGYLLDQFVIAYMNHRTDEYGGSLENRMRFPKEIVHAIKERCGVNFPVSLRYSVKSYIKGLNRGALPGEDFKEVGRDIEESKIIAKEFEKAGFDALDCDNGTYDSWFWPHPPTYMPKACNLKDVTEIKKVVNIPVICAGKFDNPELAEQEIAAGNIDMMGMGRPLLADPEIVNKFKNGTLDNIRPCICCHMGCLGKIFQPTDNDISCALNPACGNENHLAITKAEKLKHILVVGGGIGGMEAARVSSLRGHSVDLYEKNDKLGGVFVAAATPSFKDDDKRLLEWYRKQMKDLGVNVHLNTEITKDIVMAGKYDEIFVATGSTPRKLSIKGLAEDKVSYAIDALGKGTVDGDNIVIIGGGLTGCEMAYEFSRHGKKVSIVELDSFILNAPGLSAANMNMLLELLDHYNVTIYRSSSLTKVENSTATIETVVKNQLNIAGRAKMMAIPSKRIVHNVPVDHVVISVGYTSNTNLYEEIKNDNVHLIGDAQRPANVMAAIWGAYKIARNI